MLIFSVSPLSSNSVQLLVCAVSMSWWCKVCEGVLVPSRSVLDSVQWGVLPTGPAWPLQLHQLAAPSAAGATVATFTGPCMPSSLFVFTYTVVFAVKTSFTLFPPGSLLLTHTSVSLKISCGVRNCVSTNFCFYI